MQVDPLKNLINTTLYADVCSRMLRMQVDPLKNLINTTLLTYADVC
jgi:hypothetical protein